MCLPEVRIYSRRALHILKKRSSIRLYVVFFMPVSDELFPLSKYLGFKKYWQTLPSPQSKLLKKDSLPQTPAWRIVPQLYFVTKNPASCFSVSSCFWYLSSAFTNKFRSKITNNLTSRHRLDPPGVRTADDLFRILWLTEDGEGQSSVPNVILYSRTVRQCPAHTSRSVAGRAHWFCQHNVWQASLNQDWTRMRRCTWHYVVNE